LSFFDETDEPAPTRRVRRPAGTGRRPPSEQQVILVRRAVAGVAILVVIIVLAIGVHSCQVSSRNSALRSYNTSVGSLIQRSDSTGSQLFGELTSASSKSSNISSLQQELFSTSQSAASELEEAESLSPPSQVSTAQQNFVLALSLRHSGIADIANRIQQALNKSTATDAIQSIATDMQEFLASDVVYTTQTAPQIAAALHAADIAVGQGGETIQPTSFLPDLGWLTPSYVAGKLGASLPSTGATGTCPSVCGSALNSVSVGGVPLSTGGGNTIPASPTPTFTANFTNTGQNPESAVTVQVSVTTSSGTTITASKVQPTTQAGQTYNLQIPLSKAPATGSAQVTVTVEKVAGETNLANNSLQFPVTFD
jgi:hypothetical protein